ncbi:NAD(P)H-dependent glycerol-3-phosphate dehydrogenase [Fructilactobacillus myrtifloralis]|uniref:Glycerol-3-phosphate dehydrogenase [NAD(P)+] n=1 Tax=Fructilactobacillus myrtifloralis TaxID=2940301 RepID=A0ABY5BMQ9_9LACO|nr:NAD(P)H-dependent glycerol-3-phosphate dehydrogenase [Fructilactobacillus myrtifloralis]USS84959.1 NAD(P)H-dependent glycerol-3-phosphate dehydrogenase [Fructilactobacillus myrtifloralis]
MTEKIAVLGAGSWGSMLAAILNENGHEVQLWTRSAAQADELNQKHTNRAYIQNYTFPENLRASTDLETVLTGATEILFIVPAQATRAVATEVDRILAKLGQRPALIHGSKGLETTTHLRVSQILAETISPEHRTSISVISGPSHAEGVVKHDPTLVTVASDDFDAAQRFQHLFMNDYFRVYTNADVIGVEFGGALKNIIALASGALAGLGYGDNARAALMTRGVAEISRLGVSFGANPLTFAGLSGMGDVIVTATSTNSRNYRAGYQLGQGVPLADVVANMGMVIEGIATSQSAYELAQTTGISMPITEAIHAVLEQEETVETAIHHLMTREGQAENG